MATIAAGLISCPGSEPPDQAMAVGTARNWPASRAARRGGTATKVVESDDAIGVGAVVESTAAGRGSIEQGAASMSSARIVSTSDGSACPVGGDVGVGVAAADHDDVLAGEILRAVIVDGVQLAATEVRVARHGGEEGLRHVPVALTTAFARQMSGVRIS